MLQVCVPSMLKKYIYNYRICTRKYHVDMSRYVTLRYLHKKYKGFKYGILSHLRKLTQLTLAVFFFQFTLYHMLER